MAAGVFLLWSRTSVSPPAAPAARHSVSVLIADFANKTGDVVFDGSIEHALSLSVEGAPFIAAYPRREALRLASQIKPGGALDEQVAQLVARREGINVVLAGAIAAVQKGFALSVRALDGATGGQLAATSVEARGKDAVLDGVARCAVAVRRALGDAMPEGEQLAAAETFTAGSLEAAHAYARAQDLFWAGRQPEAIDGYKQAIALDPALGRAYAGLAATYNNSGNRDEAGRYYELTMKHLDRMSDREKLRTLSAYYLFVRNPDRAIEELDTLVRQFPADSGGLTNLALAKFYRRDMIGALDVSRRALRIYPENVVMRNNMALYAMYAGDFDTSRDQAKEVLRRNQNYAKAWLAQAIVAALEAQGEAAAELYDRLAVMNASLAALGRADLAMLSGQLARATHLLRKALDADRARNPTAAARELTALAEAAGGLGHHAAAIDHVKEAVALSRGDPVLVEAARVEISLARYAEAEALARRLGDSLEADPRAYGRLIEGEVFLARRDFKNALRLFRDARNISDLWLGRVLAGRAYVELGSYTEAYAELDTALKRRGEAAALFLDDMPTTRVLPALYYWRGRAQEGLGSSAAVESYRQFLTYRSGDTVDALVADARHRVAAR
jgi:tetratricopeptide (TPR) repeat protein